MKSFHFSLLALSVVSGLTLATPASALAGNRVEVPVEGRAEAAPRVLVDLSFVDVTVTVVPDQKEVIVKGQISAESSSAEKTRKFLDACKIVVVREGDAIRIRHESRDNGWRGLQASRASGHIDITLPASSLPHVEVASGDIRLKGELAPGQVDLSTASGDIAMEGWAEKLRARSASGSINVAASRTIPDARLESASGSVKLVGGATKMTASVASGDIEASGLLGEAALETASGDIKASWSQVAKGARLDVESVSGDVMVSLPTGVQPGGSLESISGRISTEILGKPGDSNREFNLVGSDFQLRVETVSGDISVQNK